MTLDPGILRPGGAVAAFQNSSPQAASRAAAVTSGGSFPVFSRFRPLSLPPSTLFPVPHFPEVAFQSNSLGWREAGARDKKHCAGRRRQANTPWRTLPLCFSLARLANGNPPFPAQVAERARCSFHSLQAHMEIQGYPHRLPKPASMVWIRHKGHLG